MANRTARLLMNILLQAGYHIALIRIEDRLRYISAIEKAEKQGILDDSYLLIFEAVERSLDTYLDAASKVIG
jgi:hypothetical protein